MWVVCFDLNLTSKRKSQEGEFVLTELLFPQPARISALRTHPRTVVSGQSRSLRPPCPPARPICRRIADRDWPPTPISAERSRKVIRRDVGTGASGLCRTKPSNSSVVMWLSLRRGLLGVPGIYQIRERNAAPALLPEQPDPLLQKFRQGHGFAEDHQQVVTVHHEERWRFPSVIASFAGPLISLSAMNKPARVKVDLPSIFPGKPANRLQAKVLLPFRFH